MPYKSRYSEVESRFRHAVAGGLTAAARHVEGEVRRRVIMGYTTGDYRTGTAAASLYTIKATRERLKAYISTDPLDQVDYMIYWELGHYNVFIGRYVRIQHFANAIRNSRQVQEERFLAAFNRRFYKRAGGEAN